MELEICCYDFQSCIDAAGGGAARIELCADPGSGGTTPSFGLIRKVIAAVQIPVFPIIRCRGGDFLYSEAEFEIMKTDIRTARDAGCTGVVIGFLHADGSVDKIKTARFVELAYPMEVTFHRAFDRAAAPMQALNDIIDAGCQRILTSGQRPSAIEGIELLKELNEAAGDSIIIMPGGGIRANNILEVAERTGAINFHSAATRMQKSAMHYVNPGIQESSDIPVADKIQIRQMSDVLATLNRPS